MKIKLLTLGLTLASFAAFAQQNYTVKAKSPSLKAGSKAYLVYPVNGQRHVDSTTVTNGAVVFKGSVAEPTDAVLAFGANPTQARPADMARIVLENGSVSLSTSGTPFSQAFASGTPSNVDAGKMRASLAAAEAKMKAVQDDYGKFTEADKKDEAKMEALQNRYEAAAEERTKAMVAYAQANPTGYAALQTAAELANDEDQLAVTEGIYNKLSPALQATASGKRIAKALAAAKLTGIGAKAPDFTMNDVNGKPVTLSAYNKGKYVLVDFWASWCGPCRGENPNVVAAYNKYKGKNFTVLGVSLDKDKAAWEKAIADDKLAWTHVSDLKFWENAAAQQYGIRAIPANVLLDPQGKIVGKNLRGEALESKLAQLLK